MIQTKKKLNPKKELEIYIEKDGKGNRYLVFNGKRRLINGKIKTRSAKILKIVNNITLNYQRERERKYPIKGIKFKREKHISEKNFYRALHKEIPDATRNVENIQKKAEEKRLTLLVDPDGNAKKEQSDESLKKLTAKVDDIERTVKTGGDLVVQKLAEIEAKKKKKPKLTPSEDIEDVTITEPYVKEISWKHNGSIKTAERVIYPLQKGRPGFTKGGYKTGGITQAELRHIKKLKDEGIVEGNNEVDEDDDTPLAEVFGLGEKNENKEGLSNIQLEKMMENSKIENFIGVFANDQLSEIPELIEDLEHFSFIKNTENIGKDGHWVAIVVPDSKTICYYDSFGEDPSKEFTKEMRKIMEAWSDVDRKEIQYKINHVERQRVTSDKCGWFSALFIKDMVKKGKSFMEASGFEQVLRDGENEVEDAEKNYKKFGHL
jgi:hypothetical protein